MDSVFFMSELSKKSRNMIIELGALDNLVALLVHRESGIALGSFNFIYLMPRKEILCIIYFYQFLYQF